MLPYKLLENVLSFTLLFLATRVFSQVIFPDDNRPITNFTTCNAESYCTPHRRCLSLRFRSDWQTAGVTCGNGSGAYRRVCCPRQIRQNLPQQIQLSPSTEPDGVQHGDEALQVETQPVNQLPPSDGINNTAVIFPDDNRPITNFTTCNATSSCIPIRRCLSLRSRSDWQTAGVTCGYGSGAYRSVCCPRQIRQNLPQQIQLSPSTEPDGVEHGDEALQVETQPVNQLPPSGGISNTADCGRSPASMRHNLIPVMSEGDWPWMVAIRIRGKSGNSTPWCTGFLIDRTHVLSAAHCFERRDEELYSTRIGKINQDEADEYLVSEIRIPEGYRNDSFYDDIAILKLSREVSDPNFVPICLPDERLSNMNLTGMGMTIVGWGTEGPGLPTSRILIQDSNIEVVSNSRCSRIFRDEVKNFQHHFPQGLTSGILCAHEWTKYICGNSGGPLMFNNRDWWFAVGITSFGNTCGQSGIPVGYTRVSNYVDWIRQNTRD